jgi:hypothetical protein
MRAYTAALLPLDSRVFVSVLPAETQPTRAIARVGGVYRGTGNDSVVTRLQFALMPPTRAARLATLLESPVLEADDNDLALREAVGGP